MGVISESDIIRATYPMERGIVTNFLDAIANLRHEATERTLRSLTVADAMTAPAITATPYMSIWEAAALTERHGIKRLPVVDKDGGLVGVVSRADLVRIMGRNDQAIRADILETISILGEDVIESLEVQVHNGVASMSGKVDRKSTRRLAIELARRTPGIIKVVDHVRFELDDEHLTPAHRAHAADPWATGPLVKEYGGNP